MKKYIATYWRSNPQLKNGGYKTKQILEAESIVSAKRQALSIEDQTIYGNMTLIDVKEA